MEPYYERLLVINNRQLKYKGIFKIDELFIALNRAMEERGYEKREKKSEEMVTETGKKFHLELRPIKSITHYGKTMIKIKLDLNNIVEIADDLKGEKRVFQKGDVLVTFDSWVLTDYDHRWGMKPFLYFAKAMINKFIYQWPLEGSFPGVVAGDTAYIYARLKKLLNSYKLAGGKFVQEEDVMREIEQDVEKEEMNKN